MKVPDHIIEKFELLRRKLPPNSQGLFLSIGSGRGYYQNDDESMRINILYYKSCNLDEFEFSQVQSFRDYMRDCNKVWDLLHKSS